MSKILVRWYVSPFFEFVCHVSIGRRTYLTKVFLFNCTTLISFCNAVALTRTSTFGTLVKQSSCPICFQVRIYDEIFDLDKVVLLTVNIFNFCFVNAEAILFNGDISTWDVRNVEEIWNIFDGAVRFHFRS